MSEFQSHEEALRAYLWGVLQAQMEQNPQVIQNFLLGNYSNGAQIYQTFQQYAPQESSYTGDDSMMEVTDSQQYMDSQQYFEERQDFDEEQQFFNEKEYVEESDDELDPDEFETEEEAKQYAITVAYELLEEIISEFLALNGAHGVIDLDDNTKKTIVQNHIINDVWYAMSVA